MAWRTQFISAHPASLSRLCQAVHPVSDTCSPWQLTNGLTAGGAGAQCPSGQLLGARQCESFLGMLRGSLPTVIVGMPLTYDAHLLCQHGIRTASIPYSLFDGTLIGIGLIRIHAANVPLYAVRLSPLHSSPIECLPSSWRSTTPLEPRSSVCSHIISP